MAARPGPLITSGRNLLRSGLLHSSHWSKDALKLTAAQATAIQSHHSSDEIQQASSHAWGGLASHEAAGGGESPAQWAGVGPTASEHAQGARRPDSLLVLGREEQLFGPPLVQREAQLIERGKNSGFADSSSASLTPQRLHRPVVLPVVPTSSGLQAAHSPTELQLRRRETLQGVSLEGCLYRRTASLQAGGLPGTAQALATAQHPLFPNSLPASSGAHPSHTPHRGLSSAPWGFTGASGWGSFGGSPEPQSHKEDKILGYAPEQLFGVVADVARYQEFVPWCMRSEVLWTRGNEMEAELEIGFQLLKERYTSHVTMEKPYKVVSTVGNSLLFDFLNCHWEFLPGPVPQSCHLYFSVEFQFKSTLYRQVSDLFFNEVVCCLVSSFEQRCAAIHGPARRLENLQRA